MTVYTTRLLTEGLRCDGCHDRTFSPRRTGLLYRPGQPAPTGVEVERLREEIRRRAHAAGWTIEQARDYCPSCARGAS